MSELRAVLVEVHDAADPAVRGIIITGAGEKAFVAGADIVEMSAMSAEQLAAYVDMGQQVTLDLEGLPLPVIAVVNGFALGGGCELALACDFIYATADASFGLPEVGLGLIPGFGGTVRLADRIGIALAREMTYTARRLSGPRAMQAGLVNEIFDTTEEALDAARQAISTIATHSRTAVAVAKRTVAATRRLSIADALVLERGEFVAQFATSDAAEGTSAFIQKRRPVFPSAG